MNLVIDIGNTRIKVGVFEGKSLIHDQSVERDRFLPTLKGLGEKFPVIDNAIIAEVGKKEPEWVEFLQGHYGLMQLSSKSNLPFSVEYDTPETLGLDRIALASAAFDGYPNKNVLVVDAGTCITYDFIDKNGTFHGGGISPGINMKIKALHQFTDKLPLISSTEESNFFKKTTFGNIETGVFLGTAYEINGFIAHYQKKYRNLTIILTGGDAEILSKRIKNTIFAPSNFLLKGLNVILEYNTNE